MRPFPAYRGSDSYVFASYAHADANAVYPALEALRHREINIWYDEGIEPGESWREELASAIENAARVIYFVSARSVASRNCLKEINFALSREVPVTLVYLEPTPLPSALEFSLGDEQAIHADHYGADQFLDKLAELVEKPPNLAGIVRSPPRTRSRFASWKLAVPLLIAVLGTGIWLWTRDAPSTMDDGARVLAVSEFAYHGEAGDEGWIGAALTNLVSDRLADSRYTELVSQTRWQNLRRDHPQVADLHEYARSQGIRYVVSGEILTTPSSALLSMRISDLMAGVDVGARTFENVEPRRLGELAFEITEAVSQSLSLPSAQQRDTLSADFAAQNYAAYQAYVAGLEFYNRFAYDEAAASMSTALRLDPEFHMARFRLANIQLSQGRVALAIENLDRIPDEAPLSQRERYYVDGLALMARGDNTAAIELFRRFTAEYPYEVEAQQYLAESLWRDFQIEEAIAELQRSSEREPENHHVWAAMGYMLLSIERYEEAEAALQQYATLGPELPHPWELLGRLELQRANVVAARESFRKALAIEPDFGLALLGVARSTALLGDYATASSELEMLAFDDETPPRYRILAALDLASLQLARGAYEAVDGTFAAVQTLIDAEGGRIALALQQRGLAALLRGDVSTARELLQAAIDEAPEAGVPTRYLFARGVFEANVGDLSAMPSTIAGVREYALPPDDPDQTEERAALYLEGKLLAAQEDWPGAIAKFTAARETQGYTYRSVDLALGEAYAADGQTQAALDALTRAITERDQYMAGDPRLDLEYDRRQALLLATRLACADGTSAARRRVAELSRDHWPSEAVPACVDP